MKHFLIYVSEYKDTDLAVTNRITEYLTKRGIMVSRVVKSEDWREKQIHELSVKEDVSLILVVGGDGTVLQAVQETIRLDIPMIGINLGTLGYLTTVDVRTLEASLDALASCDWKTERRMTLKGEVIRNGEKVYEGLAMNDIVLSRSGSLQILHFHVLVNGLPLSTYHADGLIVSTPTGSTGYNLSAGGPLVDPTAKLVALTPICPHTLNQRSVILGEDAMIELVIPEARPGQEQSMAVSFDGSHTIGVKTGDHIQITKSSKEVLLARLSDVSFLEVLNHKMSEN